MGKILTFVANAQHIHLIETHRFSYQRRNWYNCLQRGGGRNFYRFDNISDCPFCGRWGVDIESHYVKDSNRLYACEYTAFVRCANCKSTGPRGVSSLYTPRRVLTGWVPTIHYDATNTAIQFAIAKWNNRRV